MPKRACLQMVELFHLGDGWRPHQSVLLLMPTVHSSPVSHSAINLFCLWLCSSLSPWARLLIVLLSLWSSCPCWSFFGSFCACYVGFKFHLLNCYKWKQWLAAFLPKGKWTGKSMLWCWPLGGQLEVVSGFCFLLCWVLHFCPTVSLTGYCTGLLVRCCMASEMPVIILSNIQYELLGSILALLERQESASSSCRVLL